jgi:hypothetical protein
MQALRLTLRGLRWRLGSSVAVLAVAVVAAAAAALGPLYATSAEESLVRESLAQAAPVTTGVQFRGAVAGQTQFPPEEVAAAVTERAADPGLDPWYGPATSSLTVANGSPRLVGPQYGPAGRALGIATVSWYDGQCEGIELVEGRCPAGDGEAMISDRLAEDVGIRLGDELRLGITPDPADDTVVVVGTYDPTTADQSVWGLASPNQYSPAQIEGAPDRLDEVLVDEQTMLRSTGDLSAVSFRALDAGQVRLPDLGALDAAVVATTSSPADTPPTEVRTTATSGLPAYLTELEPQRDAVGAASLAVTAQLVLLAWFVLFLVVAGTSEERSGEVALAKLRGMTPGATVAFGLGETVLLLVLSLPLGLALAWLTDVLLASEVLTPGTSVVMTPAVAVALLACFAGGITAAFVASRSILRAPVLDQLRRTGGRRARLARSVAVDAAAVALAAAAVYELRSGSIDTLALLAPGLLSLAVGLLAVRLLPRLARAGVARTRASGRIPSFLATRNIARRPGGLRVVVLLTVAVGLAVFAVDGWMVASSARADLARAEVGGWSVLHVRAESAGALVAAVRSVDPDGRQAAAAAVTTGGDGGLLLVDAQRLAAVTAWDPEWAGTSTSGIGPLLHPAAPAAPVEVRDRIALVGDVDPVDDDAPVTLGLQIVVRPVSGVPYVADLGDLRTGVSTYSAELPPCRAAPCTLASIALRQPVGLPGDSFAGQVRLGDATDSAGEVDLAAPGADGWRIGSTGLPYPADPDAAVVTAVGDGAVVLDVDMGPIQDAAVEVADHPLALPVLRGSDNAAAAESLGSSDVVAGVDGRFLPADTVGTGVVARLLRRGAMGDLPYAIAASTSAPTALDLQVWLAPTADDAIGEALAAEGVELLSEESVADREVELGRSGDALALRLFLIAALAALLLGAGTLLASAYVVLRRRAYELAALRALGATRRDLVSAGRREQLLLAAVGVGLGLVTGLAAASVALGPLLAPAGAAGPPVWLGPAWSAVLVLVAVVLVALAVVAHIGARRTVDRALPDLLRQVQE